MGRKTQDFYYTAHTFIHVFMCSILRFYKYKNHRSERYSTHWTFKSSRLNLTFLNMLQADGSVCGELKHCKSIRQSFDSKGAKLCKVNEV